MTDERGAPPEKCPACESSCPKCRSSQRLPTFTCHHDWHYAGGAPPEKPVCLICGLPPDHEWHGVSNHVYVPKLAGHDSAGAANSPSPEVRQAWEEGRDEVCNMLVYAGAALDRGSPLKDCLASLVESGKAMQYPGPAAPPATKEGK